MAEVYSAGRAFRPISGRTGFSEDRLQSPQAGINHPCMLERCVVRVVASWCRFLDPETGLQALPTLFLFLPFLLLSYFPFPKALLFLNQS